VKTLASRLLLACVIGGIVVAATAGPANARRNPGPDPLTTTPTPAPLYDITSPPPTVDNPSAMDVCANDAFQSYRTVPMPYEHEVTICGLATSGASAAPPVGRGASAASFFVDTDGTQPIAVTGSGASVKPGDVIVVRGRYHRENGGGEGIDSVHAAAARGWAYDGYVMVNGQIYR
jgi:hypothetical protein